MKTILLIAKQYARHSLPEDYVDWATEMLKEGTESESLKILASLSSSSKNSINEYKKYFKLALKEIEYNHVYTKEGYMLQYAKHIAMQTLEGDYKPREGAYKILELKDYCESIGHFWHLLLAIDEIEYQEIHNSSYTRGKLIEDKEAYIKTGIEKFVESISKKYEKDETYNIKRKFWRR